MKIKSIKSVGIIDLELMKISKSLFEYLVLAELDVPSSQFAHAPSKRAGHKDPSLVLCCVESLTYRISTRQSCKTVFRHFLNFFLA